MCWSHLFNSVKKINDKIFLYVSGKRLGRRPRFKEEKKRSMAQGGTAGGGVAAAATALHYARRGTRVQMTHQLLFNKNNTIKNTWKITTSLSPNSINKKTTGLSVHSILLFSCALLIKCFIISVAEKASEGVSGEGKKRHTLSWSWRPSLLGTTCTSHS